MNCRDVQNSLDDYVDGLLRQDERESIVQHLNQCDTCRQEERSIRALITEAGALPKGITPATDLWPGVSGRLADRTAPRSLTAKLRFRSILSNRTLLAAAAVIIAVIATAVTTTVINNRRPSGQSSDFRRSTAIMTSASISSEYESAELEYQRATEKLDAILEERRSSLSPETLAIVDENRRIIDQAIQEIRDALEKDPGSQRLNGLLLAAYKRDLELLRQVAELPVQM